MYVPDAFREEDTQRLHAFIRDYSFGLLVTVEANAPFASHLPFIFDEKKGAKGMLIGHMARANPQWRHFENADRVLAIFQGPHTYISPAWYAHAGVPTWNYTAVHVYGRPRVLDNPASVAAIVERLTALHEARYAPPWQPDMRDERTQRMLEAIVGFEIEVSAIEGKFKLNQNRPAEDRKRVIARLRESDSENDRAVAELMSRGS